MWAAPGGYLNVYLLDDHDLVRQGFETPWHPHATSVWWGTPARCRALLA